MGAQTLNTHRVWCLPAGPDFTNQFGVFRGDRLLANIGTTGPENNQWFVFERGNGRHFETALAAIAWLTARDDRRRKEPT